MFRIVVAATIMSAAAFLLTAGSALAKGPFSLVISGGSLVEPVTIDGPVADAGMFGLQIDDPQPHPDVIYTVEFFTMDGHQPVLLEPVPDRRRVLADQRPDVLERPSLGQLPLQELPLHDGTLAVRADGKSERAFVLSVLVGLHPEPARERDHVPEHDERRGHAGGDHDHRRRLEEEVRDQHHDSGHRQREEAEP